MTGTDPKDKRRKLDERLDKALEESFPASDPPTVFGDTGDEVGEDEEEEGDGQGRVVAPLRGALPGRGPAVPD